MKSTNRFQLASAVLLVGSMSLKFTLANEERFLRLKDNRQVQSYADPKSVQEKMSNLSCTPEMVEAILLQMPTDRCPSSEHGPCFSHCIETACPVPTWLEHYYSNVVPNITPPGTPFVGISVGCNKGIDAVDTLRMGSNSPRFDKMDWVHTMFEESATAKQVQGACRQGASPPFSLIDWSNERPAVVHCIEPVPSTAERLEYSVNTLGYNSGNQRLVISPYAISDQDTSGIFFPTAEAGTESKSLSSCDNPAKREALGCKSVEVYSLDTYGKKFLAEELKDSNQNINILGVDAEGFDFNILKGGQGLLTRAEYLEFEYHRKGPWADQTLKQAIDMLDDIGFNCYWAGRAQLWRLNGENCFLDHYESKCWSNVACVNPNLAPELADIMEDTFHKTLLQGQFKQSSKVKRDPFQI